MSELPVKTVAEIAVRMDALDLWDKMLPYRWAVKPRGTAFPYFVLVVKGDGRPVKARVLLLEGWQTFHDWVRMHADGDFGFYSSPLEVPRYELAIPTQGTAALFRHDTGYVPFEVTGLRAVTCLRMLWEAYGVMMRVESDPALPLRYSDETAMFARVEDATGAWADAPLKIPDPRPHVESVSLSRALLKKAKDLPFAADEALEVDFAIRPGEITREKRPRFAYLLAAVDAAQGERVVWDRVTVNPETGLRGLWEGLAPQLLARLIARGRIPGALRVRSGRLFRMLRPLGLELPFKLSLHQSLPTLAKALAARGAAGASPADRA